MKNRKYGTRWITLMALFVAIQLFLNLTGIGLIPLPVIKGTTLHIPVIIGAVILGPMAGASWEVCSVCVPFGTTP